MVPIRRPSIYHHSLGHGPGHGTGPRIFIFWFGETEIGPQLALGRDGLLFCHHIPVVPLGLFIGIFTQRIERFHRGSSALWPEEYAGEPQSR
jgi:hypothetical protein